MTTNPTDALVRIRQMADYWEQHLPEVIRTPAVVSALRAVLDVAAPAPAAPAVVEPPSDRAALPDPLAEAALGAVEAALGDTLVPAAREEALAGIVAVLPPPADRAAEIEQLRTKNERMRHELEVMYGGAFDSTTPADRAALERVRAVLETEAVGGRNALEYRGLIASKAAPGPCGHRSSEGHLCGQPSGHHGYHRNVRLDGEEWTSWVGEQPAAGARQDGTRPDFTSPIAGRIEVRDPCPYCGDRQMVPRSQFAEHVARLHPDARQDGATQ
mgnify:CR=1 FL=1